MPSRSPPTPNAGVDGPHKREGAARFDSAIHRSLEWVRERGRFYADRERQEEDLFREGQAIYRGMCRD